MCRLEGHPRLAESERPPVEPRAPAVRPSPALQWRFSLLSLNSFLFHLVCLFLSRATCIPPPSRDLAPFIVFFAAAVIASSSCNADFMLGKRLVTEGCTQFSSAVLFFKALAEAFTLTPLSSFFCSLLVFIKTLGASEYTALLSD